MIQLTKSIVLSILLISALTNPIHAQVFFDAETGIVLPGTYNDIRQPASTGTAYNAFGGNFKTKHVINLRGRVGYTFHDRHTIFVTYAPLTTESKSRQPLTNPVQFEDILIPSGQNLTTRYQFNGYRFTYRYSFLRSNTWRLAAGLTAVIRDAYIQVSDEQQSRRFNNVGFVPALSLYVNYQPGRFGLLVEGDGLASKQGRLEDLFAGVTFAMKTRTKLRLGYRLLEGGADVNNFYNFAQFNALALGLQMGL